MYKIQEFGDLNLERLDLAALLQDESYAQRDAVAKFLKQHAPPAFAETSAAAASEKH